MLRLLARMILRLGGWEMVGGPPPEPRAVFIAAPHTSNWDGFWALVYKVAAGIEVHFFAKDSLFWFPLGTVLRALGGIPINRGDAGSAVQQAIDSFSTEASFYLGLAPEGTRRRTRGWKTGFYRIARGAGVPVYLGFLDYGNKRLGIGPRLDPTGDAERDLAICRDFYSNIRGRWPGNTSPVEFVPPDGSPRQPGARKKAVRSFVRRAGRMTPSQKRALEGLWPTFGIDFCATPLDFASVFGRTAPVVVEIGFGNGETLVEQAAAAPGKDFVGIEVHEPGVGHCLLKASGAGITNLRLIAHDAIEVLDRQIPRCSVARVNLYFPDPWPKKRHHKRRIVQPAFVDLVADRLQPGGTLHIATDWGPYADHIDRIFDQSDRFTLRERREHGGERPLDRPQTKFERRGLARGHRICDWCLQKN